MSITADGVIYAVRNKDIFTSLENTCKYKYEVRTDQVEKMYNKYDDRTWGDYSIPMLRLYKCKYSNVDNEYHYEEGSILITIFDFLLNFTIVNDAFEALQFRLKHEQERAAEARNDLVSELKSQGGANCIIDSAVQAFNCQEEDKEGSE